MDMDSTDLQDRDRQDRQRRNWTYSRERTNRTGTTGTIGTGRSGVLYTPLEIGDPHGRGTHISEHRVSAALHLHGDYLVTLYSLITEPH
jgi:hypothetical protein